MLDGTPGVEAGWADVLGLQKLQDGLGFDERAGRELQLRRLPELLVTAHTERLRPGTPIAPLEESCS